MSTRSNSNPERGSRRAEADLRTPDATTPVDAAAAAALREHLAEIGAVLDLPTKRPTRATGVAAVPVVSAAAVNLRLRRWAAGAIVLIGVAIAVVTLWPERRPQLPPALLGEWSTAHPDYAGKRLIFKPEAIEIGISESALPSVFQVSSLTAAKSADTTRFGLTYQADEGAVELHIMLLERDPPRLILQRPADVVWERRFASSPP